jgi:hypothetical protein
VYVWQEVPADGAEVSLIVDRADPRSLHLADDRFDVAENVMGYVMLLLVPLGWAVGRRINVWRSERLVGSAAPAYSMTGVLHAGPWPHRRLCLSLYPLDAAAGSPALCTVPVLTGGGAPLEVAFPVEVKGLPRRRSRVAVRSVGGSEIWPSRGAFHRPGPSLADAAGPPAVPVDVPASTTWTAVPGPRFPLEVLGRRVLVAGALIAPLVPVAVVTMDHHQAAKHLEERSAVVLAEVVSHGGDDDRLTLQVVDGDDRIEVPVDFASDYPVGIRYPVRVDPDHPGRGRLVAEPYDRVEPILYGLTLAIPGALVLVVTLRRWWRLRRLARRRPSWAARVVQLGWAGSSTVRLAVVDALGRPLAVVQVPSQDPGPTDAPWSPRPVLGAGDLDPHTPVVLQLPDGRWLRSPYGSEPPRGPLPTVPPPPVGT